jgi:class 3 adenylate cyclase/tetratricopeptide (TPR) repeat protein
MSARSTIRCGGCGAEVSAAFRHCDECGKPLARACPGCGQSNRPTAKFCGACGYAFESAASQPAPAPDPGLPIAAAPRPAVETVAPRSPPGFHLGRDTLEGERKIVTVLFADVRGSMELIRDLDPEDAAQLLEPALKAMVDGVRQYGGTVNRVQGDGVMALFGAPIAHEDHAERACLAALQMLREIPRAASAELLVRVGINSGPVLVKRNLNDMNLDYDAIGAAAHIANRLEQAAASNTAVMSGHTMRLVAGAVRVKSLGKLTLKGLPEPQEAYELVGSAGRRDRWHTRSHARPLSPFIGRETELATLTRAQARAASGTGQVAILVGDPGTGKSRLLHEFLSVVGGSAETVRAAASPFDHGRPFASVAHLARSCLGMVTGDEDAPLDHAIAAVISDLGPDPDDIATPLRFLLDRPIDDPVWDALDTAARRERIVQAIRRIILVAARTAPLVLVIEDLHWADRESRAIFETIMEQVGANPVMILATTRPEYVPRNTRSHTTQIRLHALDAGEADQMLRRILGDSAPLAELRRLLISRTEGTPLFIEETLQMLFDSGTLIQRNGVELTRPLADILIPESVQAVIAARIDTLPHDTRTTLQIASVIGRDVPFRLLAAVAGVPSEVLERQLQDLVDSEFLFDADLTGGRGYTFKHMLIQAVAYVTMLARRRRQLHTEILAELEREFEDRLDEVADRLAEHAEKGREFDKAAHYLAAAGRRANGLGAHHTALTLFDRAIVALEAIPRTQENVVRGIDARLGLRVALGGSMADFARVLKCLDEAEELARGIDDQLRLALINVSQCNILVLVGEIERALSAGTAGLAAATVLADVPLRVNARFALGQAHSFSGDLAAAIDLLEGGLPDIAHGSGGGTATTTGSPAVLYLCCLANAHALAGNFTHAHTHSDAALNLAVQTGRRYDASYANLSKGLAYLTQGAFDNAVLHLTEAHRVCHEAEIIVLKPSIARFFGLSEARAGRGHVGRKVLHEASLQSSTQGLTSFDAWCKASLAEAALVDGDVALAIEASTVALEIARARKLRPIEVHALRVFAEASERGGGMPGSDVRDHLETALRLAESIGMRPEALACRLALARHLGSAGDDGAAETAHKDADRLAEALQMHRYERVRVVGADPT